MTQKQRIEFLERRCETLEARVYELERDNPNKVYGPKPRFPYNPYWSDEKGEWNVDGSESTTGFTPQMMQEMRKIVQKANR